MITHLTLPNARAGLLSEQVDVVQQFSNLSLQALHPSGKKALGLCRCR
jgi:hypothetical protein